LLLLDDLQIIPVVRVICEASHFVFPHHAPSFEADRRSRSRMVKIYLASWRLSADTAANACGSKVIGRRFYDARCVLRPRLRASVERGVEIITAAAIAPICTKFFATQLF
jgi:hypothetical protein